MPVVPQSAYPGPPWYQYNGHLQTVIPTSFRKVNHIYYERERLELPDGDFLDLDWINNGSRDLVILSHGLEGSSDRTYVKGMARFFHKQHWDVLAWNCRSCSGEMNRNFRLYYHGDTEDISQVINHVLTKRNYKRIVLIGFSMGGNITLKYVGTKGKDLPEPISHAIAFSTPCDLKACVEVVEGNKTRFYHHYFLNRLKAKIRLKAEQFPHQLDISGLDDIETWLEFDTRFSAPLNHLPDAAALYYEASAKNFVSGTAIPTLIVNAQNDPVLDERSTPKTLAKNHPNLFVESPPDGGHVGFALSRRKYYWSELRAWEFCHSN